MNHSVPDYPESCEPGRWPGGAVTRATADVRGSWAARLAPWRDGVLRPARRRAGRGLDERHRREERIMPRLSFGAVSATCRTALRRLDTWTLDTLNSGGRLPRLG